MVKGTAGSPRPGDPGKERRCGKAKGARIIMVPASAKDTGEREALSREIGHIIGEARRRGDEPDPGLVRAKEAIDDEKNHLLVARSRWGELLGSLSYTFPDPASLRVDYIGFSVHRCGLGTRLMAAVAEIALQGNRRIALTAEKDARGFFERLGMELVEEFPDGNCIFRFSHDSMRRLVDEVRLKS
ncbi:MAG TPA: GNAT family N-acetyltransferase [Methanomicrobiales archaeon]|jgi:GNAT superfamily N-acetyltransferase|nr:GNAT family N-acetyltransferase [Methanomicrobiales archaeon]